MRQIAFEANNLTTSTRRNTHNAAPDLRPKIARPSSNRLSHMHLSLADRYLGRPTRLPKTWTQLACRPYEILSKPKPQNSFFFSRLTLGQSFGTSRADFAWAVLSSLTARIFLTLGRSVGTNRADFAWTGSRPTTRRDTHNAPSDLRRKIARPSWNRFGFTADDTARHT